MAAKTADVAAKTADAVAKTAGAVAKEAIGTTVVPKKTQNLNLFAKRHCRS